MVDGSHFLHPRHRLHMRETGYQHYNDFAAFLFNSGSWIRQWGQSKNPYRDSFGAFMLLCIFFYIQYGLAVEDDKMLEE